MLSHINMGKESVSSATTYAKPADVLAPTQQFSVRERVVHLMYPFRILVLHPVYGLYTLKADTLKALLALLAETIMAVELPQYQEQ